ncbi:MAG: cobyrinate a,c-diamide synthase [Flexilinea sp.]
MFHKPGFIIAAPNSGSGKSMVAAGLMAAFAEKMTVQGYKVGPDFIDPMYHSAATGHPSINLDPWMLSPDQNRDSYIRHAATANLCITEGVMGLFDATGSNPLENSTAGIANLLKLPILFVVDCSKMSGSAAALIYGFNNYHPEIKISGVIFNRVGSPKHERLLRDAIGTSGIPVVGFIPNQENLFIPGRHLGLFTVAERENEVTGYLNKLKIVIKSCLDLDRIFQMAENAGSLADETVGFAKREDRKVRIAVARDKAFCFYYEENLQILETAGAEIVDFSPLENERLPQNTQGIYLGGGYPELYAEQLSSNKPMLNEIRAFARRGCPIYAECGGLIYLTEGLTDFDGKSHSFAGILPGSCRMQKKVILGYRTIIPQKENWLLPDNLPVRGHEFHYSAWDNPHLERAFLQISSPVKGVESKNEGYAEDNVIATYIHIHFGQNLQLAGNFVHAASLYLDKTEQKINGER